MKLAVAIVVALTHTASAHPLDIGYLRIDATGSQVSVALDVDIRVATRLLGRPAAESDAKRLAELTYRRKPLVIAGTACAWTSAALELRDRTAIVTDTAACGSGALHWPLPFVVEVSPTFQLLVKAGDRAAIVDRDAPVLELEADAPEVRFRDFVWTGIEHIGAAPSEWRGPKLPDGIDHILFVLALLLAGGSLAQLAAIASGFTIGHSITLALATLDVVRPPASVIEPLIALSIAIVAAEAFRRKPARHRWKVATCFGLIHGFGFAGALRQLDLSTSGTIQALFGYNLGVELGQLAIIAAAMPMIAIVARYPRVRLAAAGAIFIAGSVWFVQRSIG